MSFDNSSFAFDPFKPALKMVSQVDGKPHCPHHYVMTCLNEAQYEDMRAGAREAGKNCFYSFHETYGTTTEYVCPLPEEDATVYFVCWA